MNHSKGRIAGLDGVRALCVLLVFVEHFVVHGYNLGGLGVKIFFALSGFLIVGILHAQRSKVDAGRSQPMAELKSFWKSRSLRIFPIYYLVLAWAMLMFALHGQSLRSEGLPFYALFLGNLYVQFKSHAWSSISHLWSLSIEQHFYMLASPLLLWVAASQHRRITLGLLGLSVAAAVYDFSHFERVPQPYLPDLPFFAFMACGGLVALARAAGRRALAPVGLLVVFGTGFALFLDVALSLTSLTSPGPLRGLRELGALMMCFAILSYLPAAQDGWLVRALEIQPLRYLGTISYGFYLYHYFVPAFADYAGSFGWMPYARAVLILAQFAFTCLLAALSWELLEKRILKFKGTGGAAKAQASATAPEVVAGSPQTPSQAVS